MKFACKQPLWVIVLCGLPFILIQCTAKSEKLIVPKETPPVPVDIMIASNQPIQNIIEANGSAIANEYVELRPEVSGRLIYLDFPEGKMVKKGTILARVNDADLLAQIEKSKVLLDIAEKTADRDKQLLEVNGINQADYDMALNQVNSLKADIVYTQTLVDKTVIKAPFDGVLGLRQVSPGAYVTPQNMIATLQQTAQVKIDFTVPDMYGNVIKTGNMVEVELNSETKQRGLARIIAIEPGANTDTRNLKIRALLSGSPINPGAFVKVFIDAGKGRASVKIPANCIIPDDKNNQAILIKNGKASFVDIKTGVRDENNVEILKGIQVGDSVVVTGVLFARPNSKLLVRKVKQQAELDAHP